MRSVFLCIFMVLTLIISSQGYINAHTFSSTINSDSVTITLPDAEKRFQEYCLPLLIKKYEITQAQAQVIQSRLFINPSVNIEYNLFNPGNNKVLETSKATQNIFALQQVLQLAGKRSKNIQLSKSKLQVVEKEFEDLVRNLLLQLRNAYILAHYNQERILIYESNVLEVSNLVKATNSQTKKGNLPLTDEARITSMLINLQEEEFNLKVSQSDVQSVLTILLGIKPGTIIKTTTIPLPLSDITVVDFSTLLNKAIVSRPDLQVLESEQSVAIANSKVQKALATPDLTLGYVFDRRGSAFNNYSGVSVGIDLPIFNRNQGAIKIANAEIEKKNVEKNLLTNEIESQVSQAYYEAKLASQILLSRQGSLTSTFDQLQMAAIENYRKGNISLIQFIDLFEAYNQSRISLIALKQSQWLAYQKLNFVTGASLF